MAEGKQPSYKDFLNQQKLRQQAEEKGIKNLELYNRLLDKKAAKEKELSDTLATTLSLEKKLTKEMVSGKSQKEKTANISKTLLDTAKKQLENHSKGVGKIRMTKEQFAKFGEAVELVHSGMVDLDSLTSLRNELIAEAAENETEVHQTTLAYLDTMEGVLVAQKKSEALLGAADDLTGGMASKAKEVVWGNGL